MPRSNSLSRVGPCANSSTKLPPTRLMAAIFPGSRRTPRVGISGPSTARRRSAFIGKVRTSPWPGAPGFQRRSIPPIEAGTTSPRPVPHSTSVSCARATSSWRDTPAPRASFIASAVLRAAAALTPNPWDTGSGVSLKILISMERGPTIFSTTRRVTSAGRCRSFTRISIAGREASHALATVWTPRLNERPAPREPFTRGFGFSTTSKKAVTCPGQKASPSDTMQDCPPNPLRRERFRSFERLGVTFSVEDRDRRRVSLDLRHVVRHDEIQIGFFREDHRLRLQLRLAHGGFRLEPDQGLSRPFSEVRQEFRGWFQLEGQPALPTRDFSFRFFRRREIRDGGGYETDVRVRFLRHGREALGHGFVGRRREEDRDAGTEGVGRVRRHGRVIDPLGDFPHRVRRARRD